MGLFSSKTKIYVSSTVYNMAGDDFDHFVPSTLVSGATQGVTDLGEFFMKNLLDGAGIRLKKFYRWCKSSGYSSIIGMGTSYLFTTSNIRREDIATELTQIDRPASNQTITVNEAYVEWYDDSFAADLWVFENRPNMMDDNYSYENLRTQIGGAGTEEDPYTYKEEIKITFTNGETVVISKEQYDPNKRYLVIRYTIDTFADIGGIPTITDSVTKYIFYGEGTGRPYFDKFFSTYTVDPGTAGGTFYPPILMSYEKRFLADDYWGDIYKWSKKAYKKVTGATSSAAYNKVVKKLQEAEGIKDVNFVYIQFGSSINSKNKENCRYIFEFFQNLYSNEKLSILDSKKEQEKTIAINSSTTFGNFNIRIGYQIVQHNYKSGKINEKARKNHADITTDSYQEEYIETWEEGEGGTERSEKRVRNVPCIVVRKMISNNRWEEFWFKKLNYDNIIFGGKAVNYNAFDELNKEEESGFIIPLEYTTLKDTGLINSTDLGTHCNYIVLNSYIKKKIRWYQRGIFKVFVTIIAVALSWCGIGEAIAAFYYGMMFTMGLITSAAAAAVATTLAYGLAMATLILGGLALNKWVMPLIFKAFTAAFGETVGRVLAVVAVAVASVLLGNGFNLSGIWGELCSVSNILNMTSSALGAMNDYLNSATQTWIGKTQDMMNSYNQFMDMLGEKTDEMFGSHSKIGTAWVNALSDYSVESPTSFLNRTSSIISTDMSIDLIHNYPKYTLALPLNGVD